MVESPEDTENQSVIPQEYNVRSNELYHIKLTCRDNDLETNHAAIKTLANQNVKYCHTW